MSAKRKIIFGRICIQVIQWLCFTEIEVSNFNQKLISFQQIIEMEIFIYEYWLSTNRRNHRNLWSKYLKIYLDNFLWRRASLYVVAGHSPIKCQKHEIIQHLMSKYSIKRETHEDDLPQVLTMTILTTTWFYIWLMSYCI